MKRSGSTFELESPLRRRVIIAGGLGVLTAAVAPRLRAQQSLGQATPSVGDSWRYQYRSDWRTVAPQTIDYTVTEVSSTAIRDRMTVAGLPGEDLRTFTAKIEEVNRPVLGFEASEFSPYLQAFTPLAAGSNLPQPVMPRDSMFGLPWSIWVRVAGPERVTVPAEALWKREPDVELASVLVPVFGTKLDDDIVSTAGRLAESAESETPDDQGAKLDVKDSQGRTPMTYAEGVFLAVQPPVRKPSTIALLEKLMK